MNESINQSINEKTIKANQLRNQLIQQYACLSTYTYLESS